MEGIIGNVFCFSMGCITTGTVRAVSSKLKALSSNLVLPHRITYGYFHTNHLLQSQKKLHKQSDKIVKDDVVIRRKTQRVNKILLIDGTKEQSLTLEEATKIAKHRKLNLVNVSQATAKMTLPIYKLVSGYKLLAKNMKHSNVQVKKKMITINPRIEYQDLKIKVMQVAKSLRNTNNLTYMITFYDGQKCSDAKEKFLTELKNQDIKLNITEEIRLKNVLLFLKRIRTETDDNQDIGDENNNNNNNNVAPEKLESSDT